MPPKVKDFLWRVCRDCLPHKVNLRSKHIVVDTICPRCDNNLENSWHIFVSCPFSKEVWRCAGMEGKLEELILLVEGISELVMKLITHPDTSFSVNSCMLLWQLWKDRNCMIFESTRRMPAQVVRMAAAVKLSGLNVS